LNPTEAAEATQLIDNDQMTQLNHVLQIDAFLRQRPRLLFEEHHQGQSFDLPHTWGCHILVEPSLTPFLLDQLLIDTFFK
jgi:hypothetical protein